MKALEAYNVALKLIGKIDNEKYARRSISIINGLQKELAFCEGITVTEEIKNLDDVLQISNYSASRVLPYGIAASFALADRNGDMYSEYNYMYRALCRMIKRHGIKVI